MSDGSWVFVGDDGRVLEMETGDGRARLGVHVMSLLSSE